MDDGNCAWIGPHGDTLILSVLGCVCSGGAQRAVLALESPVASRSTVLAGKKPDHGSPINT